MLDKDLENTQESRESALSDQVDQKLKDAMVPGEGIEFTLEEAELAGAFMETAISVEDVLELKE